VVGSKLRDDVLHDLHSSTLIKLRRKWAGLVARSVHLYYILNSSGKLNRRDREWKLLRHWWDKSKIATLIITEDCGIGVIGIFH
jgi:hypothetical protein